MYKLEEQKVRRKTWIQAACIPKARVGWSLEDCKDSNQEDIQDIKGWLGIFNDGENVRASGSNYCGKGLLLAGKPGRGKSTVAAAILQDIMRFSPLSAFDIEEKTSLIRPCYFMTFNDVLALQGRMMDSPTDWEEVLYYGVLGEAHDSYNIRVLVIDDVGKEHASLSGWQKNVLHHVLRTRFNRGLPTIVTTNILLEDWSSLYGDATESFAREAFMYFPMVTRKGDLRE
jgi:DNA replication protein DnaC